MRLVNAEIDDPIQRGLRLIGAHPRRIHFGLAEIDDPIQRGLRLHVDKGQARSLG